MPHVRQGKLLLLNEEASSEINSGMRGGRVVMCSFLYSDGLGISQTPLSIKFLVPSLPIHGHLYISQHYWKLNQN